VTLTDAAAGGAAVAVVIATRGRAALLAETLAALHAQTLPPTEVIVVDDESPDETPAVVAESGYRHIRVRQGGPSRARDLGWRASSADVIAFTDDDCRPDPGWLEALVEPITSGRADLVQGRTIPRPDHADRLGPWSRTMNVESENGFYQTCNIAYRRDVLEQVGGFHPGFPYAAAEDTELAWRAKEAGFGSTFAGDAVVEHVVWPSSFRHYLRDRRRWGSIVLVVRLHPQLRYLAYRRYFYRPSHLRVLALAALLTGAGLVRRWAPPLLAAGGVGAYVVKTRGSEQPPTQRAAHIVRVLVADSVETAVFVRATIRYRTLLL
jgi:glycosyltransferase involved in cell wall biosynthesis